MGVSLRKKGNFFHLAESFAIGIKRKLALPGSQPGMRDPRGQSRECVEAEWGETEESFTWRSASSKANEASRSCGEPECGVTEKTGLHLDNSFEEAKVL